MAIERIFVKKAMVPRPLATAIEAGVFSEEFTAGLTRVQWGPEPEAREQIAGDAPELARVQAYFHELIRARAGDAGREHGLSLPVLQADAGTQDDPLWFAIEGMHGGFKYCWDSSAPLRLMTESWSRAVAGSGQLHEVTAAGARLLGQEFV